jgi:hypothetical protein
MNWDHYGQIYGQEAAMKLMEDLKQWVLLAPDSRCENIINYSWGLRGSQYRKAYGQMLAEVFEASPRTFAYRCLKGSHDYMNGFDIKAVYLLAEYWGISYDDAYTRLNRELPKY